MDKRYLYFVEGECEEKFINIFKAPPYNYFLPGKVVVFNLGQSLFLWDEIKSNKS